MKRPFLTLLFTVAWALNGQSDDTGEHDVKIVIPRELDPPPSEEDKMREKTYSELHLRASAGLPYSSMEDELSRKSYFTLGNSVKQCTNIAIVSALSCEPVSETNKLKVINLRYNVESNLFGILPPSGSIDVPWVTSLLSQEQVQSLNRRGINATWRPSPEIPETGQRFLVFLSPRNQSKHHEFWHWKRSKQNQQSPSSEVPLFSFGDAYNVIRLDDEKRSAAYVTAVTGYLRHLQDQRHNVDVYYVFLKELMHSPISRIKDDARSDLVNFLRTCPSFDLNRVLEDKNVDDGIKEYVRLILLPSRQPPKGP